MSLAEDLKSFVLLSVFRYASAFLNSFQTSPPQISFWNSDFCGRQQANLRMSHIVWSKRIGLDGMYFKRKDVDVKIKKLGPGFGGKEKHGLHLDNRRKCASSGIGVETAKLFCQLGAKLALTGRNEENLNKTVEACKAVEGSQVVCIVGDVTKEDDVKRIIDETIKQFGKLDILVNNAGILDFVSIETTTMEQYDRVMDVNVRSVYHLTMLAVPYLIQSKGNIVNVSSITGLRSFPDVLAYCMSKSAEDQFTKCCSLDLAPKQVRVNAVNPGVIITDLHARAGMNKEDYAKFLARASETHPLGHPGKVEEVASTIAFLASENASFITGAQVPVDGGLHAACPR